jgi:hypothetical protein
MAFTAGGGCVTVIHLSAHTLEKRHSSLSAQAHNVAFAPTVTSESLKNTTRKKLPWGVNQQSQLITPLYHDLHDHQ